MTSTGDGDKKVVEFPQPEITPEERARRLRVEVERLARLAPGEWRLYADEVCEKYKVSHVELKAMIEATIKANEKRAREDKAEDRQREARAEKQQDKARREEKRARREEQEEEERARKEEERASKEAARKQKEKDQAFAKLIDLPSIEHEARLAELARRLDEDLELLRDEFAAFVATEDDIKRSKDAQPWEEAVSTQALLTELLAQIRCYVVMHDNVAIAAALWVMFSWVHDIAVHSPNLNVTSPEADCGKTTLLDVLSFLVPWPCKAAELTAASVYRIVDRTHPTLIVDEADSLFRRKPALTEIVNVSWTRGTKIWRPVNGVDRPFDVFCPKIICGKNLALADTTASRGVTIKLWPKSADEIVEDFDLIDNDSFVVLRRKLARWSADNAAKLKDARPAMPVGFRNRMAANWRLLLAIADLAGDAFAKSARAAAVKLSRKRHLPSEGLRLLEVLAPMVANRETITSAEIVKQLTADKDSEWCEFRGRGPITQRGVALLLDLYEIDPDVIHPTSATSARGYRCAELRAVIARMLPQPYNRTSKGKKPR